MQTIAWGKPTLRIGDVELDGVTEFKPLLVERTAINDEGELFWNDNMEHSISFEIPNSSTIFKSLGKLFKYRIPRKKKKAYKKAFCARFDIPLNKVRFRMSIFNNQKRLKNGRQDFYTKKQFRRNP
jgi:hypothetical protein